ncbi:hypothetical protein AAHB34_20460 [Paenarthrobacter ureafaciens]
MRTSFALIRRACVPVVGLSLLVAGFSMPAAQADTEPPATPAESTGSEAEAVAQAQAQATSTDVVVEDATTPTLLTVAHPDGTLTSTVDTDPVRMKTEAGWTDISTDPGPDHGEWCECFEAGERTGGHHRRHRRQR